MHNDVVDADAARASLLDEAIRLTVICGEDIGGQRVFLAVDVVHSLGEITDRDDGKNGPEDFVSHQHIVLRHFDDGRRKKERVRVQFSATVENRSTRVVQQARETTERYDFSLMDTQPIGFVY